MELKEDISVKFAGLAFFLFKLCKFHPLNPHNAGPDKIYYFFYFSLAHHRSAFKHVKDKM